MAAELLWLLGTLRQRGRLISLATGLCWSSAVALLAATALLAAIGWWGGGLVRPLGWGLAVTATLATALLTVVRPWWRLGDPRAPARAVGRVSPGLASDVLSGFELAAAPADPRFSAPLVEGLLRQVTEQVLEIPSSRIFPLRPLALPLAVLLVAGALGWGVWTAAPQLISAGAAAMWREPAVPQAPLRTVAARAPVVGDLSVTLRYPGYLERPDRRLQSSSGVLVAPRGTTVVLEGRSLVAFADRGRIELPGGHQQPIAVNRGSGAVSGRFVILEAGEFSFVLGDADTEIRGPARRTELEADDPPGIRLLRPAADVELDRGEDIVLELEAEDDHGLSRIDLLIRAGDEVLTRRTVAQAGEKVRRLRTSYRFSPKSVRLEDVELLTLELEAHDNDTISGPKPGRSRPLVVKVLTPTSRHRSALAEQGEALDALVDLLGARLQTPSPPGRDAEVARDRFNLVRLQTEDVLGRIARLIHTLGQDPLTQWKVIDAFVKIREDLANQLVYEARLHQEPIADGRERQGVDRVSVRLIEGGVIRIDDLLIEQQLGRLVKAGGAIERQREELSALVLQYARTRGEQPRRALLAAIDRMEKEIARLQGEMESVRGRVGDAYLNPVAAREMDLLGSLGRLRELLAAGDLDAALALVARLEGDLGRVMAGLEGGLLSFRTDRFGEGERFVGELIERVMAIEEDQLQLRRETVALQRRYRERLAELMRGRVDPLVRRQLGDVARIRQQLSEIDPAGSEAGRELALRLRAGARDLELALGQGDLDEARQIASGLVADGDRWLEEVDDTSPGIPRIQRLAEQLVAEIEESFPRPARLFSARDRRIIRIVAQKQRHLSGRSRKLRMWIEEQGDETRFLSHQALESLRTVAGRMSGAVTRLEEKEIRRALGAQSEALDELARLREDLRRGDELLALESRPVVVQGRVELPSPEGFEVPPEHREDILEAMRGELPSDYREAIERYYETLVR